MRMDHIDTFAEENVTEIWEEEEEVGEGGLGGNRLDGEMVYLEAGEVSNADSRWMVVGDDYDL